MDTVMVTDMGIIMDIMMDIMVTTIIMGIMDIHRAQDIIMARVIKIPVLVLTEIPAESVMLQT